MHTIAALTLAGLMLGAPMTGFAQTETQPELPELEMKWSDPAFAEIAGLLAGTWKTSGAVAQFGDASQSAEVIMSISPAKLTDLPDAMYVETARADAPDQPYRTAFLQLYRRQGEVRMRTLEIRDPNSPVNNMLLGLWALPSYIPDVSRDSMIATLDLELRKNSEGWTGQSPHPYPTSMGGAVEMTSRMEIAPGRIMTADRGFDADGNVVWGASEDSAYTFVPTESPFAVSMEQLGVIAITLRENGTAAPSEGDTVAFQYSGWLTTGLLFDTSRRPGGRPYTYALPANAIEGWNVATSGMSEGDWRKFIVPSEAGYGASSAAGGRIPANSTLIFEAELVGVSTREGD